MKVLWGVIYENVIIYYMLNLNTQIAIISKDNTIVDEFEWIYFKPPVLIDRKISFSK